MNNEEVEVIEYPEYEVCVKLTELGFPETNELLYKNRNSTLIGERGKDWLVKPSIMEMLMVMPHNFIYNKDQTSNWNPEGYYALSIEARDFGDHLFDVCYFYEGSWMYTRWDLPNALAEMIIQLVEEFKILKF